MEVFTDIRSKANANFKPKTNTHVGRVAVLFNFNITEVTDCLNFLRKRKSGVARAV